MFEPDEPMVAPRRRRPASRLFVIGALLLMLAACTGAPGSQDDKMGRWLVAPDKYTLYNCDQLQQTALSMRVRELELEALIAKAGPSAAGNLASDMAYRPEYYQVHGEMNELRRSAAEKKCKFVPGEAAAGTKAAALPAIR
jgi:hypothetical protein